MDNKIIYLVVIIAVFVAGYYFFGNFQMVETNQNQEDIKVKLTTSKGDIVIELYKSDMPITAGNFEKLVQDGTYDGVIFHRIIDGFMIQGGDPTGTGMGDPSIPKIQDEFTQTSLDYNVRGTLSMANAGPNTGSSQFFINLVDNNFLNGKHPVFGKVTEESLTVIGEIAKVETNAQDRPLEDIKIIKAEIL
jgi:peptidylprolyl isomerase